MVNKTINKIGTEAKKYQLAVVTQILTLMTNAFGLIAALAWNNVIQELVNNYIRPYIGKDSSLISLFIYAIIITVLVVTITLQLSRLKQNLEESLQKKTNRGSSF